MGGLPECQIDRALRTDATASSIIRASGGKRLPAETHNIQASIGRWPEAAMDLLYSREFYQVIKRHLRSGGILQLWYLEDDAATTASVTKALMQSFPYVRGFQSEAPPGIHFLASMQPIPITSSAALAARMPSAAAADLVEWGPHATAQAQFESILSGEVDLAKLVAEDPEYPRFAMTSPSMSTIFCAQSTSPTAEFNGAAPIAHSTLVSAPDLHRHCRPRALL